MFWYIIEENGHYYATDGVSKILATSYEHAMEIVAENRSDIDND